MVQKSIPGFEREITEWNQINGRKNKHPLAHSRDQKIIERVDFTLPNTVSKEAKTVLLVEKGFRSCNPYWLGYCCSVWKHSPNNLELLVVHKSFREENTLTGNIVPKDMTLLLRGKYWHILYRFRHLINSKVFILFTLFSVYELLFECLSITSQNWLAQVA